MIRVRGLSKAYATEPDRPVLRGVELDVAAGEFVAIMGPSGSGKSTLMHVLGGLDTDYEGSVIVAGHELKALDDRTLSRFRNRTLGFVFQQFHLVEHLTALENALLPAHFRGDLDARTSWERARECLEAVGLGERLQARPGELSGGERQRVAVARALFNRPALLLADEPTGALDRASSDRLLALFEAMHAETGVTTIVVTHDEQVARRAHRIVYIEDGRITADESVKRQAG